MKCDVEQMDRQFLFMEHFILFQRKNVFPQKTSIEFQTERGGGKRESFGSESCKNATCHFSSQLKLPPVIKITLLPNINPSLSTPIAPVSPFVFCARGVWVWNTPSGVQTLPNFNASQRFRLPSEVHVINDAFMSLLWSLMSPDTICPRVIIMKVTGTSSRIQKGLFCDIFARTC
ncbi:hypothetical protein TNCT_441971 [Trichonephila clavata]|uniref:Uncharacterized protein n=1 Tax=Trichonephila clavata TaxID=2740835 RepID=A0A8X6M6C3_TRICU|nr:hypothetical protein TNCT_441971 [Trichonephila clavata]